MIRRIKIGSRLGGGFAVVFLLFSLTTVIAINDIHRMADMFGVVTDERFPETLWAAELRAQEETIARAIRNAVLYLDAAQRTAQLKVVARTQANVNSLLQHLEKIGGDEALTSIVPVLSTDVARLNNTVDRVTTALRAGQTDAALGLMRRDLQAQSAALFRVIGQLTGVQVQRTKRAAVEAKGMSRTVVREIIVSTAIAAALAIILAVLITRSITSPLRRTNAMLSDIADGEGDLTQRLDDSGRDEVTTLSRSFNQFVSRLESMVRSVLGATTKVTSSADALSVVTVRVRGGAEQQRVETQQVAAAMSEMAATVQQIASNTAQAAEGSDEVDRQATHGRDVVVALANSVKSLEHEIDASADVVRRTADETIAIEAVLDVIKDIAEQTNLLALNAAIEAARAGDQGRGFAVVASEVRSLAERTQNSTQKIRVMIDSLREGANESTTAMQRSRDQVSESVQHSSQACAAIELVLEAAGTINDMSTQIASAAEEQSAVAAEINRNIVNISDLSEQAVQGVQEISAAGADLTHCAAELNDLVRRFKI